MDVVLHEPAGPASTWAATVEPGATIAVMVMGSKGFSVPEAVEDRPAGYLLIGDAASQPAINGIIGAVPHDIPIELYLEQHHEDDALIPLAEHPRLRVHRVTHRDARPWLPPSSPGTGRTGTPGPGRKPVSSNTCAPGCGTSSASPSRRSTPRRTGPRAGAMGSKRGDDTPAVAAPRPEAEAGQQPAAAAAAAPTGTWRAQAAGRLLAPLKNKLIVSGVLQA